jgi:hypothetical protein
MAYQAEISRMNPSCLMFLIDQSQSMQDSFAGTPFAKADELATIMNRLLATVVIRCSKEEDLPRDYFHIAVLGYGRHVGPALGGPLEGRPIVSVSDIAQSPLRIEDRMQKVSDGIGGLVDQVVKFPVWLDPHSDNGTPMCAALQLAHELLDQWTAGHPDAFPPVVINVSDGEGNDGNPLEQAHSLTSLSTSDGNVLLFNVHLSAQHGQPIEFPGSPDGLPDAFAKTLFQISSVLPPGLQDVARAEGYAVNDSTRGFTFQADPVAVIKFLDIGTRPANLR